MKPMILTAAMVFASASAQAFCPPIQCAPYTCVDYTNGEWTDASGVKIEGAFIFADDIDVNMRLSQTDDGTASGNPINVLTQCTR